VNQWRDNRAATPFFRAFFGLARPLKGEAVSLAEGAGIHRCEWLFLSLAFSVALFVATGDLLARWLPGWVAWPLTLPALFVILNTLPFAYHAKSQKMRWWLWAVLVGGWACWRKDAGGVAGVVAWGWLGFLALQGVALLVLGWRATMCLRGLWGVSWRVLVAVLVHGGVVVAWWRFGWLAGIGAVTAIHLVWLAGVLRPGSKIFGPLVRRAPGPRVWITIDDGPDPRDTPVLLELLDQYDAKAVFFVIGEKVARHPELAREIVRRGHELGNHTMTHPAARFWRLGPSATRREIERCNQAILEATGVIPAWFRAPVGHRNYFTHPVTEELGMEIMAWNRRGYDAVCADVEMIVKWITRGLGPGDIVLLHEATPVATEVLRRVLEEVGRRGLRAADDRM
jgi:peptidoglycan/xylan/chitin deacetylase (PgdA/CDA1 family)